MAIIEAQGLEEAINELVEEYAAEACAIMEKVAVQTGKDAVKKLRETSPKGPGSKKGHYGDGWTSQVEKTRNGSVAVTIHNKNKPGLTHLLENGHLNRDGSRTKRTSHIEPVEKWVQEEFVKRLEDKL